MTKKTNTKLKLVMKMVQWLLFTIFGGYVFVIGLIQQNLIDFIPLIVVGMGSILTGVSLAMEIEQKKELI